MPSRRDNDELLPRSRSEIAHRRRIARRRKRVVPNRPPGCCIDRAKFSFNCCAGEGLDSTKAVYADIG